MKNLLLIIILSVFSTSIVYGNGDTSEYVIPPGDDNSDSNENSDENYGHRKLLAKNTYHFHMTAPLTGLPSLSHPVYPLYL